jgi:peptidoglycan/LPS O-acetylase OafA/YrhL
LVHQFYALSPFGRRLAVLVALILTFPAGAALLDEILVAVDQGQCIDGVTFRLIQEHGPAAAAGVVGAALEAHRQRQHQQRLLGCAGNIAAQAIAAGADPDQVLEATAAGL